MILLSLIRICAPDFERGNAKQYVWEEPCKVYRNFCESR